MQGSDDVRNIDGCELPIPEGLEALMSDITREVLRAQPQNVYAFIAKYLSALLQVRSNVTIAAQVCNDIHDCSCQPELDEELRNIGLLEEDVETAKQLIETFLENGEGKESSLLVQIINKTSIEESQVEAIQTAVRAAFRKHRLNQIGFNQAPETSSEQKCTDNLSSISLAGLFINLPKHIPYSVHNETLSDLSERTNNTHSSQHKDFKPSKSSTLNTIYQRESLDKENVIRFKAEMVKYVSDEEVTEDFIPKKAVEFKEDTISDNTESRSDSSGD